MAKNSLIWCGMTLILVLPSLKKCEWIVFARNCCLARMLLREVELVSEWTGLSGRAKSVKWKELEIQIQNPLMNIANFLENVSVCYCNCKNKGVCEHVWEGSLMTPTSANTRSCLITSKLVTNYLWISTNETCTELICLHRDQCDVYVDRVVKRYPICSLLLMLSSHLVVWRCYW